MISHPKTNSALLATLLLCGHAVAEVKLPPLFSDHMVLQSAAAVPVWGQADPGEAVSVEVAGQKKTAKASADGRWMVKLDPLKAGETLTLTVKGKNTLTVSDVLTGEVWLGSGQSNMQMNVGAANNAKEEIAAANFPQIRMFTVDRVVAVSPEKECGGKWVICSPATASAFSATAYFFGREIHQSRKVPVGLIHSSWGGTPIEGWTSMDAQQAERKLAPMLAGWEAKMKVPFDEAKAKAQHEKQMAVWKTQVEKAKAEGRKPPQAPKLQIAPRLQTSHPANLFNGMIAPVIPYAIRGAIWYQGENNANRPEANLYATQLSLLIKDWRQRWGQGEFPFAWVQLPNFKKPGDDPGAPSSWAVVREAMLQTLAVPNTGMAIAIDAGDADNIHPRDKQTVGKRLALWARAKVYGETIPFSGPLPAGHKIQGNEVVLSFSHADSGLAAKGGELTGFAIAGRDKKWFRAAARIEGDNVIVSSPEVKDPVAVRYAWADNPQATLTNGAGLPASPFRTDDW